MLNVSAQTRNTFEFNPALTISQVKKDLSDSPTLGTSLFLGFTSRISYK